MQVRSAPHVCGCTWSAALTALGMQNRAANIFESKGLLGLALLLLAWLLSSEDVLLSFDRARYFNCIGGPSHEFVLFLHLLIR